MLGNPFIVSILLLMKTLMIKLNSMEANQKYLYFESPNKI